VQSVGEIILGKKNPGMNYLLHIESNESKRIWYYQRKIRIRKQSASPIKLIIQFKPLGTIAINFCNIVVHTYTYYGDMQCMHDKISNSCFLTNLRIQS
jgi:hypothetical protein